MPNPHPGQWFLGDKSDLAVLALVIAIVIAALFGQSGVMQTSASRNNVQYYDAATPNTPAYLRIQPRQRPWLSTAPEGDWAFRVGQCLGWPEKAQLNLGDDFIHNFVPPAEAGDMHPFTPVFVSASGTCRVGAKEVIRDMPKLGTMTLYNVRGEGFSSIIFFELASPSRGGHLFAYRTE